MWKEKGAWQFEEQEWETERLNPKPEELNALLQTFLQGRQTSAGIQARNGKVVALRASSCQIQESGRAGDRGKAAINGATSRARAPLLYG